MSRCRSLFLVGTDTGVGKTTIAQGLLHLAQRRRLNLAPFKPVESGLDSSETSDALLLLRASARPELTVADVSPYALARPLAPALAARLESRVIPEHRLVRRATQLLQSSSALIVEAAGGLLSPHGAHGTPATLAQTLVKHIAIDILLVSANRLGAINQCALASLALERFALPCAGIVLVNLAPGRTVAQIHNATEIAAATNLPVLGELRFLVTSTGNEAADLPAHLDTLADALSEDVDLRSLLSGALLPVGLGQSP